ncbi:MAG: hypothetical protein JNK68_07490 [Betaproteobacteria bacterium]|nr:hypothetical protein [Betaproteobacteria bacterium]
MLTARRYSEKNGKAAESSNANALVERALKQGIGGALRAVIVHDNGFLYR